jgi:hypothetical protein
VSEATLPVPAEIQRAPGRALAVGVAGLLLTVLGGVADREQLFRSYHFAFLFWVGLGVGCLSVLLIQFVTGGFWGVAIRRVLEAGSRTLVLGPVLFLPVAFGIGVLFEWAHPEAVAADPILQHKAAYLNPTFFFARAALFFACWIGLSHLVTTWSARLDRGDASVAGRLEAVSGLGLVLLALTITFSSVDWGMALNAHWFSTIYGVLFMVGQALAALALATLTVARFVGEPPYSRVISSGTVHDLGKLTLAFVMLWAYVSFSQFLIVWSGNLPEEIPWYALRTRGAWGGVAIALVIFHFALPFLLLLSRDIKRNVRLMGGIAAALLLMRVVDLYWLVGPDLHGHAGAAGAGLHWMDVTAFLGVGGVWAWFYARQLGSRPLLPLGEPEVQRRMQGVEA